MKRALSLLLTACLVCSNSLAVLAQSVPPH